MGQPAPLRYAVEWGGEAWASLVAEALDTLPLVDADVLEIGGRSGRMAALLASRGARVTVVDLDRNLLDSAPREAARLGVTVRALVDPGDLSSVPDGAFDVVLTKSVLVVIPDLPAYLDTVARKLRPGGYVAFIENEPGPPGLSLVRRIRHRRWSLAQFHFLGRREWAEVGLRFATVTERHVRWPPVGLFVGRLPHS